MSLADQDARNRIEQRLDETLFVEAGAGTGKTHELVQRIVNLITSGAVQANEIAAITFTEKAAAELYDRVIEELDRQRDEAGDPQRQQLLSDASEQLDHAAIETLHAFAGRILRQHPIETGLPPGFRIINESDAVLKFAQRWQEALTELLAQEQLAEPLLTALDAGIQLADFEQLARDLHRDWDRAEQDEAFMPDATVDPSAFIADLQAVIELRSQCASKDDKLYARLVRLQPFVEQLKAARDDHGRLMRLLQHTTETSLKASRVGNKQNWPNAAHEPIREELTRLNGERERLRYQIVLSCCAPIYNEIRGIIVRYADERRRQGELEFQDLLVRASRLLESHESAAEAAHERYKRLLIDEFQDNDPLQTRMIDAITRGEPGRAFYVGDPKQSIYRFRRADIQQFNQVKQEQDDGLTKLTQNFRSVPGVTSFVNAVFAPLMFAGGADQADWENLNAFREDAADVEHAVTVIGESYDEPIEPVRQREADALARIIADITASRWQISDDASGQQRDAQFADTAVLVPTRTGLAHLLPALEDRDIPYRLESRSMVYHTREIRGLLNLLRAIDDPTDQIALVAALRSPAFACSDDDLYRWRQARGRWDPRRERPAEIGADDPVAESMRWINETATRRWELSVSELVGLVIRERRLMELSVVERQPRERWARYRFLLDQARAFCDGGGSTLSEFLDWAQHQADADTQVIESVVPEKDHDAVRIMTIHAAKGLEFPIVVFAGLNSQPRQQAPTLLWSPEGRPEVRLRQGLETPGFEALWEREKELQQQEYVRRNYVGATRARDHLIVSLYRKSGQKTDAELIGKTLNEVAAPCRRLSHNQIPDPPTVQRSPAEADEPDGWAARARWIAERQAAVERHAAAPRTSATAVARLAGHEPGAAGNNPNYEPSDDLPPWRRGRAGTAIGRATHGVLQLVDLDSPDRTDLDNAVAAQAAAESLGSRGAAEVGRLVRRALESGAVHEALAADRYWRELYAAVEIDDILIDGFIDLLYELPNGNLVVVDYKTDSLQAGEAVDAAVERYRLQAASYALILQESLGRRVERAVLLFLQPGEEREIPELSAAIDQVRSVLSTMNESSPTAG